MTAPRAPATDARYERRHDAETRKYADLGDQEGPQGADGTLGEVVTLVDL